jgi:hypothetical protein
VSRLTSGRTRVGAPDNFERTEAIIERLGGQGRIATSSARRLHSTRHVDIYLISVKRNSDYHQTLLGSGSSTALPAKGRSSSWRATVPMSVRGAPAGYVRTQHPRGDRAGQEHLPVGGRLDPAKLMEQDQTVKLDTTDPEEFAAGDRGGRGSETPDVTHVPHAASPVSAAAKRALRIKKREGRTRRQHAGRQRLLLRAPLAAPALAKR